jgi:hypothetical protein
MADQELLVRLDARPSEFALSVPFMQEQRRQAMHARLNALNEERMAEKDRRKREETDDQTAQPAIAAFLAAFESGTKGALATAPTASACLHRCIGLACCIAVCC